MFIIIKKFIKWVLIILGLLSCLLIGFLVLTETKIIKLPKEEIPILKETKAEIHEEWYDDNKKCQMIKAKYTFYGLNGIGYYQQQLANKANIGAFEFMKIQDRLKTQKEPTNLVCYIKDRHPFDRWNEDGKTYNYTTLNGFDSASFFKKDDSQLYLYVKFEKQQHKGPGGNYLILKYQGPKHFLEDDKDYYLGEAFVHNDNFELTDFYLHFNPKRRTLSLYQYKHNHDKAKEAEYLSRTNDDW
ncbi:effector [Candidatus Phytoplasma gossypii]|uniref:Effector n=1 Tax=Candidatus Phytoplasma gossypii TaxID=2982629 RepID=A0ABT9D1H7_9MOLU|nr:effector ['Gossypium sp.' phytoplasma]MDO8057526.1 effector ['Gossypium sp.' phytoplasma]